MTLTDSQLTQLLLFIGGVGGFLRLRWQRNEDRREKQEDKAAALADAVRLRTEHLEDLAAQRKEEADAREQASRERREATAEIIAKAEAEAKAMKILTEATADKLRLEAVAVAQRLAEQTKRDYAQSTATIEEKIAGVHAAATAAFNEANHGNVKIAELQQVLVGQQSAAKDKLAADGGKLDRLQATADTIDGKVDVIGGTQDGAESGKLDKLQDTADGIDEKVDTIVDGKTDAA